MLGKVLSSLLKPEEQVDRGLALDLASLSSSPAPGCGALGTLPVFCVLSVPVVGHLLDPILLCGFWFLSCLVLVFSALDPE